MALAAQVEIAKTQFSLKKILEEFLVIRTTRPPLTAEGFVRCSGLPTLCAREEVICHFLKIDRTERIDAGTSLIFAHGNALHRILQNDVLPQTGILLGQWRCLFCGKKHGGRPKRAAIDVGLVARPLRCKRCRKDEFVYQELEFINEELRLTGHPDGFLRLPGVSSIGLLEVKSVGQRTGWEVKKTPNISHVVQAQAYMLLTGLRWCKILYWNKAENGIDALTEHYVEWDEDLITMIRTNILSIWAGLRSRVLPDRICATDTCDRAKYCPVVKSCFQLGSEIPA